MRPSHLSVMTVLLAGLSTQALATKLEDVAPFPKADKGFTRQVVHLAPQTAEDNFQVEILAGKTLTVDCNRQRLGGMLEERTWKAGVIRSTGWTRSSAR